MGQRVLAHYLELGEKNLMGLFLMPISSIFLVVFLIYITPALFF